MKGYTIVALAVLVTILAGWLSIATALQTNAQLNTIISVQDPLPGPDLASPEYLIVGDETEEVTLKVSINSDSVITKVEIAD
ncbi:MAG: hypothetical protein PHU71_01270 [Candidatus Gracilibacteria bacterium]|nr:hypothetical protein [Candidatus Gracilibacteria bacterium]